MLPLDSTRPTAQPNDTRRKEQAQAHMSNARRTTLRISRNGNEIDMKARWRVGRDQPFITSPVIGVLPRRSLSRYAVSAMRAPNTTSPGLTPSTWP
jgi:hypothetical protein